MSLDSIKPDKFSDVRDVQKKGIAISAGFIAVGIALGVLFSFSWGLVGLFLAGTIFFLSVYAAAHLEDPSSKKSELFLKPINAFYFFFGCLLLLIVAIVAAL